MNIVGIERQLRHALCSLLAFVAIASGPAMAGGIGGTGITAFGVVQRFGSIYVNGREYALDAKTSVTIDGVDATTKDLRLGAAVSVRGVIDAAGHARALQVRARHAVVGPIETIGHGELSVMGQRVRFDAQTRFADAHDRPSAFSGLKTGDVVAVSGLPGPNGTYLATRVASVPPARTRSFLLRGRLRVVSGHRVDVAGRRLRVVQPPAGALAGRRVLVTGQLENGAAHAERIEPEALADVEDGDRVEFSGFLAARGAHEWVARGSGLHFTAAGALAARDRPVALVGVQRPDGRVQVERLMTDIEPMRIDLPVSLSTPDAPTGGQGESPGDAGDRSDREHHGPGDGPDGRRPKVDRPEITRPDMERPDINRPEIERPEVMGE